MPIPDNNDGAITLGLRKLRGEVPSGDLYEKNADGKYELRARGGEHVMDVHGGRCERCWFTRVDFEDAIAPKVCTGKPPQPGDVIHENSWSIIVHLGFEDYGLPGCRDPQRWCIDKRGDVSAQWREVKQMIVQHDAKAYYSWPPKDSKPVTEEDYKRAFATVSKEPVRISLPKPVEPVPNSYSAALIESAKHLREMMMCDLVTQVFAPERLPPPELSPGAMKHVATAVEKSLKDMTDMWLDGIMNRPSPGVVVHGHPITVINNTNHECIVDDKVLPAGETLTVFPAIK